MSTEVQAVVEKVRQFTREQREELVAAIGSIDPAEPLMAQEERELLARSIMGQYRDVPTSSEEFMSRRRQETEQE